VIAAPVIIVACNVVREANMLYFGAKGEDLVTFSNRGREPGTPRYWDEYLEHSATHDGEYESLGIWDLASALDHISLAAVGEGLGTCWIGTTNEWELRRVLSIPDDVQPRMIMLLGYPAEAPEQRPRKPLEDLVCYEAYS
jgi:nitroreductase